MNKYEAKISNKIAIWFLEEVNESCPFEIKHTKGDNFINMNAFAEHQKHSLEACTTKHGFVWKIPDANMRHLPFDYMIYKKSPAFVIIRYPGVITVIHIQDLLKVKTPSLSEDKAIELCQFMKLTKDL